MKEILIIIGLILNVIGAIILTIPLIKTKVKLDDEYKIVESGTYKDGEHWFVRGLFKKNRCFGLCGMIFVMLGFILQLLAQLNLGAIIYCLKQIFFGLS